MALFKILKGLSENLNNQPLREGFAYYTTDDSGFYIDHYDVENNLVRTRINPVMYFENNEIVVSNKGEVIGVLSQAEFNSTINEIKGKQDEFDSSINEIKEQIVQSDWNENNVNSNAYIQNRPFYTYDLQEELLVLTDLTFTEYGTTPYGDTLYATEETFSEWVNPYADEYYVKFQGIEQIYPLQQDDDSWIYVGNHYLKDGMLEDTGENFYFEFGRRWTTDENEEEIFGTLWRLYTTDPSATEFSIYRKESGVYQIEEKYLPDSVFAQADASEGDSSSPSYIHNLPCREYSSEDYNWIYDYPDGTSEISTEVENQVIFPNPDAVLLAEGEDHRIMFYCIGETEEDFVDEYSVYPESSNFLEINGVTFEFTESNIYVTMDPSIHTFNPNNIYYIMLARYEFVNVVEQLDPKFIPSSAMIKDWDESNPESLSYIHNRTHYTELGLDEIFRMDNLEMAPTDLTNLNGEAIFKGTGYYDNVDFPIYEGYKCLIETNDYDSMYSYAESYNGQLYFGNISFIDPSVEDNYEELLLIFDENGTNFTFYSIYEENRAWLSIKQVSEYVQTLDSKYLPYEIKEPSDWDETNEYSHKYIQNKPFYRETQYTDLPYFNDLTFIENNEGIYQATFFNEEINFEVDKIYVVDWPEYSVACIIRQDENGKIYFGNESIVTGQEQGNSGEPFFITYDAGIINIYTNNSNLPADIIIRLEEIYYHKIEDNYINEISLSVIDEVCI